MIRNPIVIFILVTLLSIMIMIVGEKEMRKKEIFTQEQPNYFINSDDLRKINDPDLINKKKDAKLHHKDIITLRGLDEDLRDLLRYFIYGIRLRQLIQIGDVIYLHIPYHDISNWDYDLSNLKTSDIDETSPLNNSHLNNLKNNLNDINPLDSSNKCFLPNISEFRLSNRDNMRSKKIIKSLLIANHIPKIEAITTWGSVKHGYNRQATRSHNSNKLLPHDAHGVDYFFVKDAFLNDDKSRLDLDNFYLREGIFIKIYETDLPSNIPVLDTTSYNINVYDECSRSNPRLTRRSRNDIQIQSVPPININCNMMLSETKEQGVDDERIPIIITTKQCEILQPSNPDDESCQKDLTDKKCGETKTVEDVNTINKICKDSIDELTTYSQPSTLQQLIGPLDTNNPLHSDNIQYVNKICSKSSEFGRPQNNDETVLVEEIDNNDLMNRSCQSISDDDNNIFDYGYQVKIYDKDNNHDIYTGKISKEDLLRRKECQPVSANDILKDEENYNCFYYYPDGPDKDGKIGQGQQGIFTHYRNHTRFNQNTLDDIIKNYTNPYNDDDKKKYISKDQYNILQHMISQGSDKNLKAVSQQKRDCDLKLLDNTDTVCNGDTNTIVNNIYYFDEDDPYYFYKNGYISNCIAKPIPRAIMYDNTSPTEYLPFGRNYRDF